MLEEIKELQVLEMQDQLSEIYLLSALDVRIKKIYEEIAITEKQLSELREPKEPIDLVNDFSLLQKLFFRRRDYLKEKEKSKQAQEKYRAEVKEYNNKKSDYERANAALVREVRELEEQQRRLNNTKDRMERIKVARSLQELGISLEKGIRLLKENGIPIVLSEEDETARDEQEFEVSELVDMGKGIYSIGKSSKYAFCPVDLMEKIQEEHPDIIVIGYEGDNIEVYGKLLSELIRNEKDTNREKNEDALEH